MKRFLVTCAALIGLLAVPAVAELSPLLGTQNADNVTLYPGLLSYPNGGFHPEGVIYTITTPVSSGTGTGAQTLGTYSLPANALDQAGRKLRIMASFGTAANTNNKTCTLNFGSESVSTPAMATSAENAWLQLIVTKTGASTQTVWGNGASLATPIAVYTTTAAAEPDTAAIVIAAICTDGTSSAGDSKLVDFFVEYMN
jgi:hypothetical protein